MDYRNKDKLLFLAIIIVVILFVIIRSILYPDNTINWQFKGPVEKVIYDRQHFAHVLINGKEYNLTHAIWNNNVDIFKGDTIIKLKGDRRIKLIRLNTKDTIYFDNDNDNPINWHFKGAVENVLYVRGGYTAIMINGKEYYLDEMVWNLNKIIYKGDSITKIKGESEIRIIRPGHRDTIYIKEY